MIKLQRSGHVLLSVRDVERSKDFYTRILGFKLLEQDLEHGGVFLSIGGHGNTLDLFQCTDPQAPAAPDAEPAGTNGAGRPADTVPGSPSRPRTICAMPGMR